jgi:hypothetical protein
MEVVRPVAGVGCSWKRKKSFAEEGGREREREMKVVGHLIVV